ncbi:hypothetical protein FRC07_015114 [Ceratobasidium sp. 392]|nr:hypothetical protein FRC07_015114 [Ceratobasidium sp. 392]
MLLAASPHLEDIPVTQDSPAALPTEVLGPPTSFGLSTPPDVRSSAESIARVKPPAHAIHTPQQLAQLEAIAQAQTRSTPESTTVSDEEKYLAAQLVYLASQHHGSEYNRQKVNQGPQSVYIPLSIQLPSHIRDLRTRQAQSTQRQAWFIAERKAEPEGTVQITTSSNSNIEGQVDETQKPALFSQDQPTKEVLSTFHSVSPRRDAERPALVQLHSVQVSLLQDALGNSVLPSSYDASPSTANSSKLSPISLSVLPAPASRLLPSSTEVDIVDTPPPLPETALPRIPPPARSRAPSQSVPKLPDLPSSHSPDAWPTTPNGFRRPSPAIMNGSPSISNGQHYFWPQAPTRPAPIHVAPTPTPQLQLALETAISKDMILDPRQLKPPSVSEQTPAGVFRPPGPNVNGAILYNVPPDGVDPGNMPHPFVHPRLLAFPKTSETHPIKAYEARAAMNYYSPVPMHARQVEDMPRSRSGASIGPSLRPVASEPSFDRPLKRPFSITPPIPNLTTPQSKRSGSLTPSHAIDTLNSLDLDLRNNGHESPDEDSNKAHSEPSTMSETSTEHLAVIHQPVAHNERPPSIVLPTLPLALRAPPAPPLITPQQPSPSPISALPIDQQPFPPNPPISRSNSGGLILGNLYMSSCPGKKVRLNGPVKGRGAINRDLGVDLARIKSIGVDLIICCLDDDEMEFLGAPWPEYENASNTVGLDVLRLPMPEGLCPLSVQAMSQCMDQIIRDYTLAGRHVLVHCRGGVGRAGLVACTWMLKLGICGSVKSNDQVVEWDEDTQTPAEHLMRDRRVAGDTLELLERVVYVIRRQRSVKAIETYEQVRFLLEFIEHLRYTDARTLSPI